MAMREQARTRRHGPGNGAQPRGTDYPDFRGKTVIFFTHRKGFSYVLTDPVVAMQAGRLFVTGTAPMTGSWTDGLSGALAWESVEGYFVYDSVEDYIREG